MQIKAKHVIMYTEFCVRVFVVHRVFPCRCTSTSSFGNRGPPVSGVRLCQFSVSSRSIEANMGYRTVVMYTEIVCFVVCVAGWILVCSTMPTEIWTWSENSRIVLTAANYFSNLWKDCISDSTGVSDCKGIPSLLALNCK